MEKWINLASHLRALTFDFASLSLFCLIGHVVPFLCQVHQTGQMALFSYALRSLQALGSVCSILFR